jgi:hypothetical protein
MSRDPLPPINFEALGRALLDRASTLVPAWLPGGAQRGHEYICGGVQGGKGNSCAVNLTTGKWADFASEDRGNDLVSLYAACYGLSMGKAALQVAREEALEDVAGVQPVQPGADAPKPAPRPAPPPAAAKPKANAETWQTLLPVPEGAPATNFWHFHRNNGQRQDKIDHIATYQLDGALLGYVVRFLDSAGEKETLPHTWAQSERDGSCKWVWRQWDEPRPLYIPAGSIPTGAVVVLVEGEKKAGVLQAVLEAHAPGVYRVVSWPGGCKAWKKALWDWLAGRTVLLWPDADSKREPLSRTEAKAFADDEAGQAAKALAQLAKPFLPAHKQPGMAAMLGIGALLRDTHGCTVQLLPVPEPGTALDAAGDLVDGWDCVDAINSDGWTGERVLGFFARAFALPAGPAGAAAGGAAAGGGGGAKVPPRDDPAGAAPDDAAGDMPWWLVPYWDAGKGRWLVSRKLVIKALECDPALSGVLGLNELSNTIDARQPWPWAHGRTGPITGSVDLQLGQYLSRTYGLPSIARAALMEGIETVAHARPFHPIRLWLAGLQHDGVPRADKWLIHALGESPATLAPALCEYLILVGRYWLLGMVYRVMEPGCKMDYCPVLEGPGGYRKSTLVEVLASSSYFSDTHFDVGRGKEGQEQVQGLWLYEIAELANFGKAEIGLIKAFITAKVDRYRPSYGRVVESFARQCMLAGTTNESTYLRDRTGNRRFWPIPVAKVINIEWVSKYRDQLFAEAYALYGQGAAYTPSHQDELRLFVPMQESRLVETAVLSEMWNVLTRPGKLEGISSIVNAVTEFVTISQMALALGVDAAKSSPALEAQIRGWFEHEGWARVKKQVNGVRAWGYARPAVWPRPEPDDDAPAPPGAGGGQFKQEGDDVPF